jgi:hypothetical protein
MKNNNIIIIFIIIAIVLLMLWCSCVKPFVPFTFENYKKHEFPYKEGFTYGQRTNVVPLKYSTTSDNSSVDTYIDMMQNKSNVECKKVMGIDGLFCKPYVADAIIDPLFAVESSMSCAGSSLTKGNGNVCLNPTQYTLLTTRGGNATSIDSQIGN